MRETCAACARIPTWRTHTPTMTWPRSATIPNSCSHLDRVRVHWGPSCLRLRLFYLACVCIRAHCTMHCIPPVSDSCPSSVPYGSPIVHARVSPIHHHFSPAWRCSRRTQAGFTKKDMGAVLLTFSDKRCSDFFSPSDTFASHAHFRSSNS